MTGPKRQSAGLILLAWFVLQFTGIFSPGLLDDVDSVYIEVAREMLQRHDFVTPTIDGIRFFDKPPLMYWLAACSMRLFGESAWAARLPLALATLALFFAIYALALHLFAGSAHRERIALYSTLVFATAIGPYLYTRCFIPDILNCLWMTLGVQTFLLALARVSAGRAPHPAVILSAAPRAQPKHPEALDITSTPQPFPPDAAPSLPSSLFPLPFARLPSAPVPSALLPCLAFAAVLALNLLTKGLIGLVFPLAFVLLYLAITRQLRLLPRFHLIPSTLLFLTIALPWHVLAALRNPAIPMPAGLGLPARAGWAWFYLWNEHFARFLGRRIPHDYGNTPVWLFWLYTLLWIMPWGAFLPAAIASTARALKTCRPEPSAKREVEGPASASCRAALTLALWALIVLIFFTFSSRQEYYSLPALPALALMIGWVLARAKVVPTQTRAVLACHRWLLLPLACLAGAVAAFFAILAPRAAPGTDLATLLASNPELYNLSLGHVFDLTQDSLGFFRGPLLAVAAAMAVVGPTSYILRRRLRSFAANLSLAAGMVLALLAAHAAFVRFNPILGSRDLALAIVSAQQRHPQPGDLILIDGELTSGSSLLFYTRQPAHLVNGRVNGPWFGSFWPGAPPIFETEASLRRLWQGPNRIFLLTPVAASRTHELESFGPVHTLAALGGKTVLSNR